jgi:hypothetical protein
MMSNLGWFSLGMSVGLNMVMATAIFLIRNWHL